MRVRGIDKLEWSYTIKAPLILGAAGRDVTPVGTCPLDIAAAFFLIDNNIIIYKILNDSIS